MPFWPKSAASLQASTEEEAAVEDAGGLEVEVFNGGSEVESGEVVGAHASALLPLGLLAFEEQGE